MNVIQLFAANETCPDCPCEDQNEVTWIGVGIAASLILVNGSFFFSFFSF